MPRPKKQNREEIRDKIISIRLSSIELNALEILANGETVANYLKDLVLKKIKKK